MFTPSLEGASRSEGVKDVTHSLEGCDLLLIAPLTYNCNIIGAFKNGTHPTSPRLGFGCQVELRNLTYNCNSIGAFKNGAHQTKTDCAACAHRETDG